MESSSSSYRSESSIVVANQRKPFNGIRIENPFSFKVAQVFTGFGIGCGIGIGVASPINTGLFKPRNGETTQESPSKKPCAIPVVGEVMRAARGATNAFSGATWHVNSALNRLGAKNVKAGIGCGVGFGHGFGIGIAVKPGVVQKIQACVIQLMMKMMTKLGIAPSLSVGQSSIPMPLQSGLNMMNEPSIQNPMGSIMQLATKSPDHTYQGPHGHKNTSLHSTYENVTSKNSPVNTSSSSRTEKVIDSFLQNPILKEDDTGINTMGGRLQSENNMLQMLLKHQKLIEELIEENEKLRHVLLEDLKISPSKLQASYPSTNRSPCTNCFECRRRQRKK